MATPQPDPAPDNNSVVKPSPQHLYTFPPFPESSGDTEMVTFKDFREGGIRVNPGPEEAEIDSLGIKTVAMSVRHDVDVCKTKTKRKRQAEEEQAQKVAGKKVGKIWWELWEETEAIRYTTSVDKRASRFERIQAATYDFANPKHRSWPAQTRAETGPKYIWEKFLRYIGLPEGYLPFTEQIQNKRKRRREKAEEDDSMSDDSDGEAEDRDPLATTIPDSKNEEKLMEFVDDPEKSIKIFMSSYSWAKGYVWSEPNLEIIPRLLGFYLNYLLRNNVLPECNAHLRRALEPVKVGLVELPNCATIMKILPDKFAIGCTECWGRRAEIYTLANADFPDSAITPATPPRADDEPHTKKQRLDSDNTQDQSGKDTQGDAWGTGDGWGDGSKADPSNEWSNADLQQMVWEADNKVQPLFEFLGPTAFPLTHTPAVVERSMRRVKSIMPPAVNPPKSQPNPDGGPNASAVEIDLDSCFTKIVLAPMPDWDNGDAPVYASPTILKSSCGAVVQPGSAIGPSASDAKDEGSHSKPHDPSNDDITLLIESKQADLLRVGMGVAGTFVQLVRQPRDNPGDSAKKKKGKSKKIPVYWYLEDTAFVRASFWAFKN